MDVYRQKFETELTLTRLQLKLLNYPMDALENEIQRKLQEQHDAMLKWALECLQAARA